MGTGISPDSQPGHPHGALLLPALPRDCLLEVLERVGSMGDLSSVFTSCKALADLRACPELAARWLLRHRPATALMQACSHTGTWAVPGKGDCVAHAAVQAEVARGLESAASPEQPAPLDPCLEVLITRAASQGLGLDMADYGGESALCEAARTGNVPAIRSLLRHGAPASGAPLRSGFLRAGSTRPEQQQGGARAGAPAPAAPPGPAAGQGAGPGGAAGPGAGAGAGAALAAQGQPVAGQAVGLAVAGQGEGEAEIPEAEAGAPGEDLPGQGEGEAGAAPAGSILALLQGSQSEAAAEVLGGEPSGAPLVAAAGAGQLQAVRALLQGELCPAHKLLQLLIPQASMGLVGADVMGQGGDTSQEHEEGARGASQQVGSTMRALAAAPTTHATSHMVLNAARVDVAAHEALMGAAVGGHAAVASLLLQQGANPRAQGGKALVCAAWGGHACVLQLLLGALAQPMQAHASTRQDAAAPAPHLALPGVPGAPHLFQNPQLAWEPAEPQGPLQGLPKAGEALRAAALGGHMEAARVLWEAGAGEQDGSSSLALVLAAQEGQTEMVQALLQWGADVHFGDDGALFSASTAGHLQTVLALLKAGADPRVQEGRALRAACEQGHIGVVEALLAHGASPAVGGQAPLKAACRAGDLQLVRLLLKAGADPHAGDEAALRTAASSGAADVVRELLSEPWRCNVHANDEEALLWAADNGHEEVVRVLLAHGACATGEDGAHALWCAISHGPSHAGVVAALMDGGASLVSGLAPQQAV